MKMSLLTIIGCVGFSLCNPSFAWEGWDSELPGQKNTISHCTDCECTDKGYYYNNCLTKREFCESFGNIGER